MKQCLERPGIQAFGWGAVADDDAGRAGTRVMPVRGIVAEGKAVLGRTRVHGGFR